MQVGRIIAQRRRNEERLKQGLCQNCGKHPFRSGHKSCEKCLEYYKEKNRRRIGR